MANDPVRFSHFPILVAVFDGSPSLLSSRSAQTLPGQVSFSADLGARFIDANAVPLTNNRYNQLASTAQPQEPASAQPPAIPQATHEPSSLAPSSPPPAFASPHPPSPPHHIDALALLSSLGVPPGDLTALSSIWDTHSEGIASGGGRRTTATVNFGFLGQDEARKALAAIQSGEYPYKDDPVQQRRYEVFLEGQAGVSRDWYSVRLFSPSFPSSLPFPLTLFLSCRSSSPSCRASARRLKSSLELG